LTKVVKVLGFNVLFDHTHEYYFTLCFTCEAQFANLRPPGLAGSIPAGGVLKLK